MQVNAKLRQLSRPNALQNCRKHMSNAEERMEGVVGKHFAHFEKQIKLMAQCNAVMAAIGNCYEVG